MFCGRDVRAGQKGGRLGKKSKRGKGTKIMGLADGTGLPLVLRAESASPAEVKLVEATLAQRSVAAVPERLIGDKAYDSERLDERLLEHYGTELIAPNKINRRVQTKDGRPLRRYRRRWKIERLFTLAVQLPPPSGALRRPCRELSRVFAPGRHCHPLEVFLR